MKRKKKTLTTCLILVMALQLLPVKQAVQYFFVDNLVVEEILQVNKQPTKNFRLVDEDHFISDGLQGIPSVSIATSISFFRFVEILPIAHHLDIQTPPPNLL